MPSYAQYEGKVGEAHSTELVLQLSGGDLFDITGHHDDGGRCQLKLSYVNAQRLALHWGEEGQLLEGDVLVHLVRIVAATPNPAFASLSPTDGRGGDATAEIVV